MTKLPVVVEEGVVNGVQYAIWIRYGNYYGMIMVGVTVPDDHPYNHLHYKLAECLNFWNSYDDEEDTLYLTDILPPSLEDRRWWTWALTVVDDHTNHHLKSVDLMLDDITSAVIARYCYPL